MRVKRTLLVLLPALLALAGALWWLGSRSQVVQSALDGVISLPYASWGRVDEADRAKRGVVVLDRERAAPGVNVFCVEGRPGGLVMDLEGRTLERVRDPRSEKENCRLLEPFEDGYLMLTREGSVLGVDRDSRLLFEHRGTFHHDAVMADGRLWALSEELRYDSGLSLLRPVEDNLLQVLEPGGELERSISFAEMTLADPALRAAVEARPMRYPGSLKSKIYNANTVEVLDRDVVRAGRTLFRRGQVLICVRNVDLIGVLDPETRRFVWSWGPGELEHPHHPSLLDNGNLLIFDNGRYQGRSRVIELDPFTNEIVWEYTGSPPESFYSQSRGAAQRLANGNTLITESNKGRVFEVTPAGEIVWEYFESTTRGDGGDALERATIYRMMRVAPEVVGMGALEPRSEEGAEGGEVPSRAVDS